MVQTLEIKPEDKLILSESIEDLVQDSPKSTVAATQFKKIALKGGQWVLGAFKEILINVTSESAKKILFPN